MSNSVAVQQKRFIKLRPSNNASKFAPKGQQPIIRFSVADTQALALLPDARLNFKFNCFKTGTTRPLQTEDFNIDMSLGMCGVMDQIIISSRRFGNNIEQIINAGRLEKAYYTAKMSPKMMASSTYHESRSIGYGRHNAFNGVSHGTSQTTDNASVAMRKSLISEQECSIPFHAGLFLQDEPVDLSVIGGLELAIHLQRVEALFFGGDVASDSSYELSDVSLTLPLIYKDMDMIRSTPQESVVEFLNWTSLFSVLDSTSSSISHRVNFSGLMAGIHNVIPTACLNNTSYNQFSLMSPGVERLTFLRDGQRNPLEKTMIVQEKKDDAVEDRSTTYPEVLVEYASAWMPWKDTKFTQIIPENIKGVGSMRSGVFGLGCSYDPESSGVNVSGVLGLDLVSKIEEYSPAVPTTTNTEAYGIYSYYLNRQAYVASPQGLKAL